MIEILGLVILSAISVANCFIDYAGKEICTFYTVMASTMLMYSIIKNIWVKKRLKEMWYLTKYFLFPLNVCCFIHGILYVGLVLPK